MIGAALLPLVLAAPAPTVALVPTRAPAEHGSQAVAIDAAAHQALASADSVRAVTTAAFERVAGRARAAGILCDLVELECVARVGAFGGFDFALAPRLQRDAPDGAGAPLRLSMSLVDCATGRVVRTHETPLGEALGAVEETAQALTLAALGLAGAPTPALAVPPVAPAEPLDTTAPSTSPPPPPGPGALGAVGIGALGAGALLGAGGLLGAWAVAPTEQSRATQSARQYNDAVAAGRVLLAVGAAGVVLGGVGATLWWLDGDDPA